MLRSMSIEALQKAIETVGGQPTLAQRLSEISGRKVVQQNISSWLHRSRRVPGEFVLAIEQATEGAVSKHDLRPDLYPREGAEPQRGAA